MCALAITKRVVHVFASHSSAEITSSGKRSPVRSSVASIVTSSSTWFASTRAEENSRKLSSLPWKNQTSPGPSISVTAKANSASPSPSMSAKRQRAPSVGASCQAETSSGRQPARSAEPPAR